MTSAQTAYAACSAERTMSRRRRRAPVIAAPTEKTAHRSAKQTASRPSSATSGSRVLGAVLLLRLVLRRTARHDLLGVETRRLVAPFDDHLASLREHVGQDALVGDRHRLAAVLAGELEREPIRRRVPLDAAGTHPALHAEVLAGVLVPLREELVHLEVVHRRALDAGVDEIGHRGCDQDGPD